MLIPHRFILFLAILLANVSLARAQLLEYSGSAVIVGGEDGFPAIFDIVNDDTVVRYTFLFDPADPPVASSSNTATYEGVFGFILFGDSDIRPLYNIRFLISRYPTWSSYQILGDTPEGWTLVHTLDSDDPNFFPDLSLPAETLPYPPTSDYRPFGYIDIYGPNNTWNVYSASLPEWFSVDVWPPVNRARGGTASASRQKLPSEGAAQAFDGSRNTKWFSGSASSMGRLQYQFGNSRAWTVIRYDITSANDAAVRDPRDWQFQGSHDGVNWTTLDTQSGVSFSARRQSKQFSISNPTAYEYYRLNVTATRGLGGGIQLAELALMSYF